MSGARLVFDNSDVERAIGAVARRMDDLSPAMADIGELLVSSVQDNFEWGRAPDGTSWPKSRRVLVSGGQVLVDTARLRNSIGYRAYRDRVVVGTSVIYAATHQFGRVMQPMTIRPRNKQALFWPGAAHPVREVKHPGGTIPARPFLGAKPEDEAEAVDILGGYLLEGR